MNQPTPVTLTRDIVPGERLDHTGPLTIIGNIGAGAVIFVLDGGLLVQGDVANQARLQIRNRHNNLNIQSGLGKYTFRTRVQTHSLNPEA